MSTHKKVIKPVHTCQPCATKPTVKQFRGQPHQKQGIKSPPAPGVWWTMCMILAYRSSPTTLFVYHNTVETQHQFAGAAAFFKKNQSTFMLRVWQRFNESGVHLNEFRFSTPDVASHYEMSANSNSCTPMALYSGDWENFSSVDGKGSFTWDELVHFYQFASCTNGHITEVNVKFQKAEFSASRAFLRSILESLDQDGGIRAFQLLSFLPQTNFTAPLITQSKHALIHSLQVGPQSVILPGENTPQTKIRPGKNMTAALGSSLIFTLATQPQIRVSFKEGVDDHPMEPIPNDTSELNLMRPLASSTRNVRPRVNNLTPNPPTMSHIDEIHPVQANVPIPSSLESFRPFTMSTSCSASTSSSSRRSRSRHSRKRKHGREYSDSVEVSSNNYVTENIASLQFPPSATASIFAPTNIFAPDNSLSRTYLAAASFPFNTINSPALYGPSPSPIPAFSLASPVGTPAFSPAASPVWHDISRNNHGHSPILMLEPSSRDGFDLSVPQAASVVESAGPSDSDEEESIVYNKDEEEDGVEGESEDGESGELDSLATNEQEEEDEVVENTFMNHDSEEDSLMMMDGPVNHPHEGFAIACFN